VIEELLDLLEWYVKCQLEPMRADADEFLARGCVLPDLWWAFWWLAWQHYEPVVERWR